MFGLSAVELALGTAVLVLAVTVILLVFLTLHSHRRAETAIRAQRTAIQERQPPIVVDLPIGMPLRLDREGGMKYTMAVGNDVLVRGLGYDQIARLAVSFLEAYVPSGGLLGRLTEWRLRQVAADGRPSRRRRRADLVQDQLRELSDENARLLVEVQLLERIIALRAGVSAATTDTAETAEPDEPAESEWSDEETLEMPRENGPKPAAPPSEPPPPPPQG